MINLIPPAAKKAVRREYYIRVLIVATLFLTSVLAMLVALSVPVRVLINEQLTAYEATYTAASKKTDSYTQSISTVKAANSIAAELLDTKQQQLLLPLVEQVRSHAGESITIQTVSISRGVKGIGDLTVSGIATTRLGLADFRDSLEADSQFATADLPLSNLAKDKDIPFTITISIAAPNAKK